jgi:exodeoxyribonuclease-3
MGAYRIFSWNVNGLRAAARKGLLGWLKEAKPDIACFQEVRAEPDQLDEDVRCVRGYASEFFPAQRKGYSGVATYSRRKASKVEIGLGLPEYDREGRVLKHAFPEFTLYNVYFPNGTSGPERLDYKLRFYADFLRALRRRARREPDVVVCGDVNTAHREIDLARPRENRATSGFLPEERAWIDRLLDAGYADTFRMFEKGPGHYTWWDTVTRSRERNVGWRLDYFFVSESLRSRVRSAKIHPGVMGSDHCPVELELVF